MAKFIKNPFEVEVEQFITGKPYPPGVSGCGKMLHGIEGSCQPLIHFADLGRVGVEDGDQIIKAAAGVIYPCGSEEFEAKFKPVE